MLGGQLLHQSHLGLLELLLELRVLHVELTRLLPHLISDAFLFKDALHDRDLLRASLIIPLDYYLLVFGCFPFFKDLTSLLLELGLALGLDQEGGCRDCLLYFHEKLEGDKPAGVYIGSVKFGNLFVHDFLVFFGESHALLQGLGF